LLQSHLPYLFVVAHPCTDIRIYSIIDAEEAIAQVTESGASAVDVNGEASIVDEAPHPHFTFIHNKRNITHVLMQHRVDNAATAAVAEGVAIDIQLETKAPAAPVGTATRVHSENTVTETQKVMEQDSIGGGV
jgi:hypothetical protein